MNNLKELNVTLQEKGHMEIIILSKDEARASMLLKKWEKSFHLSFKLFQDSVAFERELLLHKVKPMALISLQDIENLNLTQSLSIPLFQERANSESFKTEVERFLNSVSKVRDNLADDEHYKKIRLYEFMAFNISPCDIYLMLGESKFVKILCKNELYTKEIIDKYREKKVNFLYIKNEDYSLFIKDLYTSIKDQSSIQNNTTNLININIASIDYINSSLTELGVNQESLDIAQKTIESVIQSIAQTPDLHKKIKQLVSYDTYLAEHSLATASLSCAMAKSMGFDEAATLKKLIISALFHDISLVDCELSLIINIESLEFGDLSEKMKKEFNKHIFDSIEFVKKIPNLPNNVDQIILEHHERPNGKGYPHGLDSFSIHQLSAIFIVAEEFVHHYFRMDEGVKAKDKILASMSLEYSKGHYKTAMRELLRIFM